MRTTSAFASLQPVPADLLPGSREELQRVGAGERRVARREERADVLEPGGAEHRVGQRVGEDVAVRVARETARVLDPDAAEHERHALLERVRVEAGADAVLRHGVSAIPATVVEIRFRGHLEQTRIALHDLDAPARRFDEARAIGRL